jgi:hypothetical protein
MKRDTETPGKKVLLKISPHSSGFLLKPQSSDTGNILFSTLTAVRQQCLNMRILPATPTG